MTASLEASDLIQQYSETRSFHILSEHFRDRLSVAFSVDLALLFKLNDGCFVMYSSDETVVYSKSATVPEGFSLVAEYLKEEYSVSFYASESLSEENVKLLQIAATLLHKRIEEDDACMVASANAVVNVVGITYHDVRNILGSISGIVQLIELDLPEGDDVVGSIQEISSVVDRFEVSSRNTMKLYRNEPIHYNTSSVDITALYKRLLEKRTRVFSLSNIELHATVDEGLTGSLNEEYVSLFLNELLSNAFDSFEDSDNGGEIFVEVKNEGDSCRIVVEDHGSGISYDLQRHIFSLFVTTKNKRRGTGLSTIARVVGDWGGVVNFRSTPGKGSRFEVVFPFVL